MRLGRRRWNTIALLVLLAIPAIAACDARGSNRGSVTTERDSAGVTIVENADAEPAGVARWTIDTTPSVTIGVTTGDSAYEFAGIRGVRRLPNGMIVVLNGQGESAFEFRFYDSTGKHIVTHGRLGQGPGEYRWVSGFHPVGGDTVIAVDFSNSRMSWISASAGYLRSSRLDENAFRNVLGSDASGALELMVPLGDSVYATQVYRRIPNATSRAQRATSVHIVDMKAGAALNLARYDDPPLKAVEVSSGTRYLWPASAGRAAHVVDRSRARICAGISSTPAISCIDSQGRRLDVRWSPRAVPYTDEDRREYEASRRTERALRASGLTAPDAERLIAATERPEHHAPWSVLQIDAQGNLWVLEPAIDESGTRRSRFRVFNAEGRHIAFADSFPVRNVGLNGTPDIGASSVIRFYENEDGAPIVGVFRIRKPD